MSERKVDNNTRRDFRHSKDGPEVPRGQRGMKASNKRKKKKKGMARWCKGKIGVEHSVVLVHELYNIVKARCTVCGRDEYGLSVEALAQVYQRAADYVEYHQLCEEFGHSWEVKQYKAWYGTLREIKVCGVCSDAQGVLSWQPLDNIWTIW
jgi:hypothetical protein